MSEQRYRILGSRETILPGDQRQSFFGSWIAWVYVNKEAYRTPAEWTELASGRVQVFRRPLDAPPEPEPKPSATPKPINPLRAFIHEYPHVDCHPAWKYRVTLPDATTRNYASEDEAMAALLAAIERTIGGEA